MLASSVSPTLHRFRLVLVLFGVAIAAAAVFVGVRATQAHASSYGCTGTGPRTCLAIIGTGLHVSTFRVEGYWSGRECNIRGKVVVTDLRNGRQWVYGPKTPSGCFNDSHTFTWNPDKRYPHLAQACGYLYVNGRWHSPACNTIHP